MTLISEVKNGKYYWVRRSHMASWEPGMRFEESKGIFIWKMLEQYIMEDEFKMEWEVGSRIYEPDEINIVHEIQSHSDITGDMYFPCVKDALDQMQMDKSIRILFIEIQTTKREKLRLERKSSGDVALVQVI